jgi:hypothetical protein
MTAHSLNSTEAYHRTQISSLGWELTICNALYPGKTPLRRILVRDASYGCLLHDFLVRLLPMDRIGSIIEIGGGYGCLMGDFLARKGAVEVTMLDISPFLLQKQREVLEGYDAAYREEDFLSVPEETLARFDLAIMNENMGDFPTLIDINAELLAGSWTPDRNLAEALRLTRTYGLDFPAAGTFHFNVGALMAVEKLCSSRIPYVFMSEHSCEASVPEALRSVVPVASAGTPERISLKGHDEYSIKFSHLQQVAHGHRYRSFRGPVADIVPPAWTDELRFVLRSQGRFSDEGEMICQFVEDLYKYEYLVLIGEDRRKM